MHYFAYRVMKQFGLDQDIPDDFSAIMDSPNFVRPFLRDNAFEFWSRHFTVVTVLGSQREGICTAVMHEYW